MAEKTKSRSSNGTGPAQLAAEALRQVAALTGRTPEAVLGVERCEEDDSRWQVTVEVVELHRIPDSADIMGAYTVIFDGSGELEEYRRTSRYHRGQADGEPT